MLNELRQEVDPGAVPIVISGCIGQHADGYDPANIMTGDYAASPLTSGARPRVIRPEAAVSVLDERFDEWQRAWDDPPARKPMLMGQAAKVAKPVRSVQGKFTPRPTQDRTLDP